MIKVYGLRLLLKLIKRFFMLHKRFFFFYGRDTLDYKRIFIKDINKITILRQTIGIMRFTENLKEFLFLNINKETILQKFE